MYDLSALQGGSGRPPQGPANANGTLSAVIARVEEAIEAETRAIRTDRNFDIRASNARKSRYLYELTRALKNTDAQTLAAEHREAIQRLRNKLARNEAVIRAHMNALSEVADLIQNAIRNAEADGTYSASACGPGPGS